VSKAGGVGKDSSRLFFQDETRCPLPELVSLNRVLKLQADSLHARLSSICFVQLFNNPAFPTPGSLRDDFTRASYVGYTPQTLSGAFTLPIKLLDGVYVLTTPAIPWHVIEANDQVIYGWFIQDDEGLLFAQSFDQPIVLTDGLDFSFTITIQLGSITVLCPG